MHGSPVELSLYQHRVWPVLQKSKDLILFFSAIRATTNPPVISKSHGDFAFLSIKLSPTSALTLHDNNLPLLA